LKTSFSWISFPHGHTGIPPVNVFLEIAAGLRRSYRAQFVDGGLQKFCDVLFDLLADAGLFQCNQEFLIPNMGKSGAQRAFHDVVVDHGSPSSLEFGHGKGPLEPVECRWGYLKPEGVGGQ